MNISQRNSYLTISFILASFIVILISSAYLTNIDQGEFNKTIPDGLTIRNIEFRLGAHQNLAIFYAVLSFTCVTGIIGLLSDISHNPNECIWLSICIQLLYFGMVLVMDFCVFRIWGVFLEGALLSRISLSDGSWEAYKDYATHEDIRSVIDTTLLDPFWSRFLIILLLSGIAIFLIILYYFQNTKPNIKNCNKKKV